MLDDVLFGMNDDARPASVVQLILLREGDVCQRSYFELTPSCVYCFGSVCSFFSFNCLSVGDGSELLRTSSLLLT